MRASKHIVRIDNETCKSVTQLAASCQQEQPSTRYEEVSLTAANRRSRLTAAEDVGQGQKAAVANGHGKC